MSRSPAAALAEQIQNADVVNAKSTARRAEPIGMLSDRSSTTLQLTPEQAIALLQGNGAAA